jgi:hypothetical protein
MRSTLFQVSVLCDNFLYVLIIEYIFISLSNDKKLTTRSPLQRVPLYATKAADKKTLLLLCWGCLRKQHNTQLSLRRLLAECEQRFDGYSQYVPELISKLLHIRKLNHNLEDAAHIHENSSCNLVNVLPAPSWCGHNSLVTSAWGGLGAIKICSSLRCQTLRHQRFYSTRHQIEKLVG